MTRTALAAAGAAGGAITAALATGWMGAALLIVTILVPTVALCWILADGARPHRLALLLTAWRHGTSSPTNMALAGPEHGTRGTRGEQAKRAKQKRAERKRAKRAEG